MGLHFFEDRGGRIDGEWKEEEDIGVVGVFWMVLLLF